MSRLNNAVRKAAGAGLLIVIVAALSLELTSLIQYFYSRKGIKEEASMRAESQLEATKIQIMDVVNQAEAAVRNNAWIAQWCLDFPDSLAAVPAKIIEDNPVVMGSTVALVPGYDARRPLFSPYVYRKDSLLVHSSLATEEYDYPAQEWFTKPLELGYGYWSEPYIDEGGGEVLMTTYSVPIYDRKGRPAAVLTADLSLDWLTELVGNVEVYPNAFSMMISRSGQIMVCPVETLVMHKTVGEVVEGIKDSSQFVSLNNSMMRGESGNVLLKFNGIKNHVFFAPVERTGWSMSIVIPDDEIFGGVKRIGFMVTLLQLLGIGLLILILYFVIKKQSEFMSVNEQKERMEGELQIGRGIQMSMIPKIFPPFPERKDIDMAASIVPAKEVGGDLYDFYIRDEKLFFCVGDVSGKGVPASLVMAVTRSLFRTVSAHEKSPQRIVSTMNESMSDMNESNMFVTFFCGVLDMATGHLRYCNAGHNAPMMLTSSIDALPVAPNLPLGIMKDMSFQEQECDMAYDDAIFLYTDGLTEAENISNELFGEERMKKVLSGRKDSLAHLQTMEAAVKKFVGEAPQSDDLTMLFIHYLGKPEPGVHERHLILHNDIQQIPQLAEFMEAIADEKHLEQGQAMSLNLALEEAVTNVILYAYPEGSSGLVDIEAIIREHSIDFIVTDSGREFDPTAAPEADITMGVEDRPIGGLGIFMVRNIMDEVNYQRADGKNVLTMIKRL